MACYPILLPGVVWLCTRVDIVGFCRSEMLQTQYICMLYGYDIPFLSMITSGLSCVTVYKL